MADSSKTEKATPKRREKARKQGQVARSRELPGVLALAGIVGALWLMSFGAITHWTTFYRNVLDTAATGRVESNGPLFFWSSVEVFRWMVPVLGAAMLLSVAAGLGQGGGLSFSPEAMELKFDRFNPASKLGQIFSLTSVSNLLKSLLPFAVIAWIGVSAIREHWGMMVHASYFNLSLFASLVGSMLFEVTWKAGAVLLVWSGVDYLLTWQKMEGDLKMTKQEVREEHKADGNPVIKQRIRRLQRQMRRKLSLAAAKTATVVVTNPTHFAVALRYAPEMVAPTVVAKGQNLLAQQIKQLAIDNGIMLMENKPLAQALYKGVEVGDAIPSQLYQAVADILVVVFRAQAEVRRQEAGRRGRNAAGEVIRP